MKYTYEQRIRALPPPINLRLRSRERDLINDGLRRLGWNATKLSKEAGLTFHSARIFMRFGTASWPIGARIAITVSSALAAQGLNK